MAHSICHAYREEGTGKIFSVFVRTISTTPDGKMYHVIRVFKEGIQSSGPLNKTKHWDTSGTVPFVGLYTPGGL